MGEQIIGKDKTCKLLSNGRKHCPVIAKYASCKFARQNDDTERKCKYGRFHEFQYFLSLLLLTCHRHPLSHVVKGYQLKELPPNNFDKLTRLQKS